MQFDCIIPTAGKDCLLLRKSIPLILEFLAPQKIFIITKKAYFVYFAGKTNERVVLIDENELIKGLSFSEISNFLIKANYSPKNTGWYFQQFLKMGFALSQYANKYYLSWDADTIPTKPINFFSETGSPFFTMKDEYHEPYFLTLKRILNLDKITKKSFISENMMFSSELMKELISKIENSNIEGYSWCEKIINALPKNKNNSFSEFETYGTYALSTCPKCYVLRELNTFRDAGKIFTRLISVNQIKRNSVNYDMISLEHRHNPKYFKKIISLLQKVIIMQLNKVLDRYYKI